MRAIDGPDDGAPSGRPVRRGRYAGAWKANLRTASRDVGEIRNTVGDRNRLQYITGTPEVESIVPIRTDVKHCIWIRTYRAATRFLNNFRIVRTARTEVRIVCRHLVSIDDVDFP